MATLSPSSTESACWHRTTNVATITTTKMVDCLAHQPSIMGSKAVIRIDCSLGLASLLDVDGFLDLFLLC